ncbi:hypothetical protein D6858_01170 [Tsuneonella suprasediminis]|uniref:Uncharacterized protein n=1 Tax=Tsuneonella suprasediminis TaxID=2306996 RepID=A0A419R5U0_9SPHN|nr:hypothetical protein D6858_01170 [Tsuneonella suprasediminis]
MAPRNDEGVMNLPHQLRHPGPDPGSSFIQRRARRKAGPRIGSGATWVRGMALVLVPVGCAGSAEGRGLWLRAARRLVAGFGVPAIRPMTSDNSRPLPLVIANAVKQSMA